MDEFVAQLASFQPLGDLAHHPQTLGAIEGFDLAAGSLCEGLQKGGQQLVGDGVLQASETRNVSFQPFGLFRLDIQAKTQAVSMGWLNRRRRLQIR
jgi:hypothetical protein